MTTLADQLERLAGQHSNTLDVLVEVALFKPGTCYTAVRPNAAGTKVIYTDRAGNEVTCWARDWTGSPNLPQIIAALRAGEPENTPMTDERKALEEVFKQIFGMGPYRLKDRGDEAQERIAYRFIAMLDCGAYLDAAMMLVPERCWIRMDDWPRDMVHGAVASVCPLVKVADNPVYSATGDTMALALLGAIREAGKNDG